MFLATPPTSGPDYVNESTLATFGVATGAIFAVGVVFRKVFKINHPIVPLITALAISFGLAFNQNSLGKPIGWLVALLNSALLFSAAVGANETVAEVAQKKPAGKQQPQGKRKGPRPSQPAFRSYFSRSA